VTPVVRGSPVAFVSVITGPLDSTTLPVPVDTVTPVPPLATASVPVIPPEMLIPPVAASVPATVTFAPLTVSPVTPPDCNSRTPEPSGVMIAPPLVLLALMVVGMGYSDSV
jgi:hypothetical protein